MDTHITDIDPHKLTCRNMWMLRTHMTSGKKYLGTTHHTCVFLQHTCISKQAPSHVYGCIHQTHMTLGRNAWAHIHHTCTPTPYMYTHHTCVHPHKFTCRHILVHTTHREECPGIPTHAYIFPFPHMHIFYKLFTHVQCHT